jgi:predicted permease
MCVGFFAQVRIPGEIPIGVDVRLDARVAGFAALASLLSAILFGLAPALQASKTSLVPALKSGDIDPERRRRLLGRNALVVVQVAGSLFLLVCAAQLHRACSYMLTQPPGFRTDHMLMVTFDPSLVRYTPEQAERFYQRALERARVASGVKSAALTRMIPLSNWLLMEAITPEGYQLPKGQDSLQTPLNPVSDGYFETVGIPIVEGRGFTKTDVAQSSPVAVINETYAQRYYAGRNPVGKRLRTGGQDGRMVEIVGVARNSKYQMLFEPPIPQVYFPAPQYPQMRMTLVVHSTGSSASVLAAMREVVRGIDPDQPIYAVRTIEEYINERARIVLNMLNGSLAALGLLGLVLAMVGLYGLMSYSVSRRTREIGIRMAIGADRSAVTGMVLRRGMLLASIGAALGLALSLALSRALTMSQGVPSFNAATVALAAAALLATAALSAYLPARRASRIDPIRTLRLD